MKPTVELKDIIIALGIDTERYQAWKQKELLDFKKNKPIDKPVSLMKGENKLFLCLS